MSNAAIGNICALLTAITWAGALVLFKQASRHYTPIGLNLFKNVVGIILLAATLLVMGERPGTFAQFDPTDVGILLLSGFIGIAVGDTLLFISLELVGVGLVAIVECLFSPFALLFAFLLIGETITGLEALGVVVILSGVLIATKHKPAEGRTRKQLVVGMIVGAVAICLTALGIVMAKPVLEDHDFPLIWAVAIRLFVGTVSLMILSLASPKRRLHWSGMLPSKGWWWCLPGSILGAYLANIFWIAGFKYTRASIAAVLNQTTVVFAIVLAAIFLKEAMSARKAVALTLAMIGVLLVTIGPTLISAD